jgi:hypothetical protein
MESTYTSSKSYEELLRSHGGLLSVNCKMPVKDRNALGLVYTPGVGSCCKIIEKEPNRAFDLTNKKNAVLIVSDGSGIGNGKNPLAAYPFVEAVCVYYKIAANIDAYPLIIDSNLITSNEDFQETVKAVMPAFSYVEFVGVDKERVKNFDSKGLFSFADDFAKRGIDSANCFINSHLLYSAVIRAALDLQSYHSLHECLEFIHTYISSSKCKYLKKLISLSSCSKCDFNLYRHGL